jgi:hypothetical protein
MAQKKSGGPTRSLESAISLPIVNSFEELKEANFQGFAGLSTIMSSVVDSLSTLNSTFAKMMNIQKEQLDMDRLNLIKQNEVNAETAREDKGSSGVSFGKNSAGIGLGIIAAISGTLIGLAQGFLEGFKNTMNAVKLMFVGLKDWFVGTKFFDTLKMNVASFFTSISMQWDLAKAWFAESKVGKALTEALDGWKAEFKMWTEGFKKIGSYLKIDDAIAGWKAEIELWRPTIDRIKSAFTFIKDGILGFGTSADEAKSIITTVFETIGNYFTKIKTFFSGMFETIGGWLKTLSGMDGVFASIGKTIGKLFYPINLIMSLIDVVSGAMEGYEEEGVLGAIKGGISGLLGGIIAAPLDLLKDLISWLAEKVGLDSFSEMLDSFSFVDLFKKVINGIFDGILETLASIAEFIPIKGDDIAKSIRSLKTDEAKAAKAAEKAQEGKSVDTAAAAPAVAAAPAAVAAPKVYREITEEERQTDAYQAILKANPPRDSSGPAARAAQWKADQKYRRMMDGKGGMEQTAPKSVAPKGAVIDRTSRKAAASSNVIVAPTNTNVNAPTVNTSNSTTMAPASPRPNNNGVGNFFVDPILGM